MVGEGDVIDMSQEGDGYGYRDRDRDGDREYDEEEGYSPKGHESNKEVIRKHRIESESKLKEEQFRRKKKEMKKVKEEEEEDDGEGEEEDFYGGGRDIRWNGVFDKEKIMKKENNNNIIKKESSMMKAANRIFGRRTGGNQSQNRNENNDSSDSDHSGIKIRNADSPYKNNREREREKRRNQIEIESVKKLDWRKTKGDVSERSHIVLSPLLPTQNSPHNDDRRTHKNSNSNNSDNNSNSSYNHSNSKSNSSGNGKSPRKYMGNISNDNDETEQQFHQDQSTPRVQVQVDDIISTHRVALKGSEKSKETGGDQVGVGVSIGDRGGDRSSEKMSPGRIFSKPLAFPEKVPLIPAVAPFSHESTYANTHEKSYEIMENPSLRKYSIGSSPSPMSVSAIPSPRPITLTSPGKLDPGRIGRFNNNSTDVRSESTKG